MKIMTFYLDGEIYAVELSAVAAVARGDAGASAGVRAEDGGADAPDAAGAASLAFDLARVLGAGGESRGAEGAVLLLRGEGEREVGVQVERLGEVADVAFEGVREVPRYFDSPLLRGVVAVGEGWAVLLDAGAVIRAAAGEGVRAAGGGEGGA